MKRQLLLLSLIVIILFIISCAAIAIVLLPAFTKGYDLTKIETANIGTSLRGITTPFFTALSSVLIFFALIKQIESNRDQRLKSDGEMIFLLLNQLEVELENFSYELKPMNEPAKIYRGYYGLLNLAKILIFREASTTEEKFFTSTQGHKIVLLIKSFLMIEKRIELGKLSSDYNDLFYYKLFNFYQSNLRNSLRYMIENNNFEQKTNVEVVKFIVDFYNKSNLKAKTYLGEFTISEDIDLTVS
jgi:hypothetical protein